MKHNATVYSSPDGRYIRIRTPEGVVNVVTRPAGHGKMSTAEQLAQIGLPAYEAATRAAWDCTCGMGSECQCNATLDRAASNSAVDPTDKMVEAATAAHVAAFSELPSNPSPQEAEQYAKQAMRVALTAALKARDTE